MKKIKSPQLIFSFVLALLIIGLYKNPVYALESSHGTIQEIQIPSTIEYEGTTYYL